MDTDEPFSSRCFLLIVVQPGQSVVNIAEAAALGEQMPMALK
jgi:hypothetical protein